MGGTGAGVGGLQGGFGAGGMTRIPGPPVYAGGHVGRAEQPGPPMMHHQPPLESSAPAIPQPLFRSAAPQIATRPPLDTSRLSRESSMQSEGWGGRRSTDGREYGHENGPLGPLVAQDAKQSPNVSSEVWGAEAPRSYGQKIQPSHPSHLEAPGETQFEPLDAPPPQDLPGRPVNGDYVAAGYRTQEYGGREEDDYASHEYPAVDPQGLEQRLAPLEHRDQLLSSRRKPPPAIAKESPLKALYAKGAENYDGNRRKINLTKLLDSMARNETGGATTGAQQHNEPYPPSGVDQQPASQYQEAPSEYASEYPSGATEQYGGYGHGYGDPSEHPQDNQQTGYPPESASYPPPTAADEHGQQGQQREDSSGSRPPQSYGMPGSNQGSSGVLASEDVPGNAYPSTHDQRWNDQQRQGAEQDPEEAAGPHNPRLGHMFQPAMNPGSPSGGLNPRPAAFSQPTPFVPGQLQGQGPDHQEQSGQQPQHVSTGTVKPKNLGMLKSRKKRIFLLRPFSFFYQLVFVFCLVLNPSWTVTKVAVVGALFQATVAGYTGLDPDAFNSLVARQFPETHRVREYESMIGGVFSLVSRASGDAWTMTTAKVPCTSSSTACIWARKALHAGMTAGLTSQRSTLAAYKLMPTTIGQLGSLASETKAFLLDAGTWKTASLRSNVVSVSKATADYAVCISKNVLNVSSLLEVMDVAIECGSVSYDAMLSVAYDRSSEHVDDDESADQVDEEYTEVDEEYTEVDEEYTEVDEEYTEVGLDADYLTGEMEDYDDPYAQLNTVVPGTANGTVTEDGAEDVTVDQKPSDARDQFYDYDEAAEEDEWIMDEPVAVVDKPEAVVDEPEAVVDEPEIIQDADVEPEVGDVQVAEEPLEPVEPAVSIDQGQPEAVAPVEIPPMLDTFPEDSSGHDTPELVVADPEVRVEEVPPIVTEDSDEATSEEEALAEDDYPLQIETHEEIQARAQRIIEHEKKLSDRQRRRENRDGVTLENAEDLRSVLSVDVDEASYPPPPSTPPTPSLPYKSFIDSLIELIRANMTHIITAVVSAVVASSFFVLQEIRSGGSRLRLSPIADLLGGIPRAPRPAIRQARRATNEDAEDDRLTVHKSATSRGRARRSAAIVDDDENDEGVVPAKRTSRSKTPRAGRKTAAKSATKKSAGDTVSGASRRSSRRSASRR